MRQPSKYYRAATLTCLLLCPITATAHHHRINFLDTTIAFYGEITRVDWQNPHVYFYVDAEDNSGRTVTWQIESGSTPSLTRRGFSRDSLKVGDMVTVRGNPDRNPERKRLVASTFTNSDGTNYVLQGRAPNRSETPQAITTSIAGVWQSIGGPYDRTRAATHLPLTEAGEAAAARFNVNNDPFADCVPPPVPDSLSTPYLHEVIIGDGTITLREEYWEIDRTVYMDGRSHPEEGRRTNQGHSIGRFDGEVLVVDTVLFDDHAFGNGSGIPNGARKHMVERYSLTDNGTMLTIDYVLEDPEYLAEAVTDTRQWRYAPELELLPNQCDLENARRYVED